VGAKIESQHATMVSTRHDRIPENQIAMFQALQNQMEEIHQKSIKDRQKNEEKVCILKKFHHE